MPLNKFGQSLQGQSNKNSILSKLQYGGKGLKYTADGNIDAENLKISNVKAPTLNEDAANREYVEDKFTNVLKLHRNLEQATLKALDRKQDLLKINLKAEIAIITHNTDELKKQTKELNKHKTKITSDVDSLKKQTEELNKHKTQIDVDLQSLQKTALTRKDYTEMLNIIESVKQEFKNEQQIIKESLAALKISQFNQKSEIAVALDDINKANTTFVKDLDLKIKSINVQDKSQVEDLKKKIIELERNLYKIFKDLGVPFNVSIGVPVIP